MRTFAAILMMGAALSTTACATTGGAGGKPMSAMERAQGRCAAALLIGAIGGAIIGNNTGSGNAARGAALGLAAGGLVCVVLSEMASREDRERIRQAELAALENEGVFEDRYIGSDGKERYIRVQTTAAPDHTWTYAASATDAVTPVSAVQQVGICRYRQTSLTVQGTGTGQLDQEYVCRNPQTLAWELTAAPSVADAS